MKTANLIKSGCGCESRGVDANGMILDFVSCGRMGHNTGGRGLRPCVVCRELGKPTTTPYSVTTILTGRNGFEDLCEPHARPFVAVEVAS